MSVALLLSVTPATRLVAVEAKAFRKPSLESDGCELTPLGVAAGVPAASEMVTASGTVRSSSCTHRSSAENGDRRVERRWRFAPAFAPAPWRPRAPIFHHCKFMPHLSADGYEKDPRLRAGR